MKTRILFVLGTFLAASMAYGQETSSARSNAVTLEFKSAPAKITWLEPVEFNTKIKEKKFTVKVGLDSKEIADVKLFLNGQDAIENRGFKKGNQLADRFDEFIEREILLNDGPNTISIVAVNHDGTRVEESRVIEKEVDLVAALEIMDRRDFALIFGTDEYTEWGDLSNPVNDATTIARELEETYGFEIDLVINPTKAQIEEKIFSLYEKSYQENDQVFIFYAGHGWFNEVTKMGYIVPSDGKANDKIGSSYYSYSNLRDLVDGIPSKHVMLTLDACFGGTFDQEIARAGSRGQDDATGMAKVDFIKRKLRYKSRIYLTSGGKEYVSDGRPGQHSPFARQFLGALREYGGADEIITKSELKGIMEVLPMEPKMGDFGTNEPGSDFVFVVKR